MGSILQEVFVLCVNLLFKDAHYVKIRQLVYHANQDITCLLVTYVNYVQILRKIVNYALTTLLTL